jgi:hypothetical protein
MPRGAHRQATPAAGALFADEEHVEATWGIYQHMIAAYANPTGNEAAN